MSAEFIRSQPEVVDVTLKVDGNYKPHEAFAGNIRTEGAGKALPVYGTRVGLAARRFEYLGEQPYVVADAYFKRQPGDIALGRVYGGRDTGWNESLSGQVERVIPLNMSLTEALNSSFSHSDLPKNLSAVLRPGDVQVVARTQLQRSA